MSSDKWLVPAMARTWLGVLFLSVAALGFHPIMADTDPGDSKFQFAVTLLCLCCRSVLKKGDNNSPDFCSLVFTPGKENLLSDVLLLLNSFVAAALRLLMAEWQNTPPSWKTSADPCGQPWEGVRCINSRVTKLKLVSMGLKGTLSPNISSLSELQSLDLSYNKDLGGSLPSSIGNLKQLTELILIACSFSGSIPSDLGALSQLHALALNSNNFTGKIPSSLGNLSNLYWLDISENQLTGTLPISSGTTSGLDKLIETKHFHFGKNQLSGEIPPEIFHSNMTLIHVLFEANRLTGSIPDTIGLVKTLEVLRIDRNSLTGPVPSSINNLTYVTDLNLANNMLIGSVPDLNGMTNLAFVDLSNNSFSPSKTPTWFTGLPSLTTLVIESGRISGEVPERLFSSSQLQQVILRNNMFSGDLEFSGYISEHLQLVDLQNNNISYVPEDLRDSFTLILLGNPYCNNQIPGSIYCQLKVNSLQSYSTNHSSCPYNPPCPQGQSIAPWSCSCACPYKGIMSFRAPRCLDVTSAPRFQLLEASLASTLGLTPASISLSHLIFNSENYLQMQVELFPSDVIYFSRSDIIRLGSILSNQTFRPPPAFGPYVFIPSPYPFPDDGSRRATISTRIIAGIATSGVVLLIASIALGIYAFWQKRRAETAEKTSHPFTSWGEGSTRDSGSAPELKGPRRFSFNDIKNYTNNFSVENEIGSGGYGKVYRGSLPSGEPVAIKRAHTGSMQGGLEFKTEIELLSRVHHKNLVRLVGFCFEQEEQMLIYEYIPNGTLRQSLSGERGIVLNWYRRLRVAVDSAKGLAYLHELADPPIIHRDVKSSNILLDENLSAKVADFGLSKQLSDAEKGLISTQIKGTRGYLDPEYYLSHNLTEKSDVYSLGVVMLELITAKQAIERGMYVVHEVKLSFNRNDDYYGLRDLLDPVIQNTPNFAGFRRFVELAIRCVEELGANRPNMSDVVKEIEAILQENRLIVSSTSSSTTEIFEGKGILNHTYVESTFGKEVDSSSDALESSIGYVFSHKVEPK